MRKKIFISLTCLSLSGLCLTSCSLVGKNNIAKAQSIQLNDEINDEINKETNIIEEIKDEINKETNIIEEIKDEINKEINIIEEIKVTESTVAVTEVEQNVVDGFAIPEANTSISILNIVNSRLNLLPDNIKEVFINSGWKIIVKESRLYDDFYGSLQGITYYNEKTIYIDIREKSAKIATLHEIGHFLDNYNKTTSCSQEFKDIYESEKDKFVDLNESDTSYAILNPMEYFASVFNEVILHPESCYANTPLSYNYILNIMENTK